MRRRAVWPSRVTACVVLGGATLCLALPAPALALPDPVTWYCSVNPASDCIYGVGLTYNYYSATAWTEASFNVAVGTRIVENGGTAVDLSACGTSCPSCNYPDVTVELNTAIVDGDYYDAEPELDNPDPSNTRTLYASDLWQQS